jgi:glycosyltransferase involved in cell wall biosynthesis
MLENRDIIIMSADWNRLNPGCVQRVAVGLAERNRVLWVSGVPIRAPRLQVRDFKRILEKGRKMVGAPVISKDPSVPVIEIHPFCMPYYDFGPVRRFNDYLLRSAVLKKVRELHFTDYILIPTNPMVAGVVGTMGESSSHYICTDNYEACDGAFKTLPELERALLQKVDSCFSTSHVLMGLKTPKSGENHFISQGVDTNHFKSTGGAPPTVLARLKKPIVGYYGLLESWVDFELIVRCAESYPHVSFVIMGETKTDISILSGHENITRLDHIPYGDLPRYAEVFDVALIPRRINELTVAMNPIKLLEYLALELPVVSTNLPEVKRYGDLVFVAEDNEHFVRLIGQALKDNAPDRKKRRRLAAEGISWASVADRTSEVIQKIDEAKVQKRSHLASASTRVS